MSTVSLEMQFAFNFLFLRTVWTGQAHWWGSLLELSNSSLLLSLHPTGTTTAYISDNAQFLTV